MESFENNTPQQPEQPEQETMQVQQPEQEMPEAQQRPQEQVSQPTQQPYGYYHGAGTGQREQTYNGAPYVTYHYSPQQPPQQPRQPWDTPWQQTTNSQPAAPVQPKKKRNIWKKIVAAVLVIALVAVGCGVSVVMTNSYWKNQFSLLSQRFDEKLDVLQQQIDANGDAVGAPGGELTDPQQSLSASQIYQQNVNSVVAITSTVRTNNMGQIYEATSAGTGFVITPDGYIVTNHHVIEGATKITITMFDGTVFTAALVGSDATNDVALLKANVQGLATVTIGTSGDMRVGDSVVAIGNALGELSSSLTVGYVSGINRNITTDGSIINMLQTDAAINSGNSGGPLFNARGEVIGITTAKYSGTTNSGASIEGISFAIPIDDVIGMLDDLKEFGYIRSAYLGVMVRQMDPDVAAAYGLPMGVYVEDVTAGNCAAKAGVRAKDIIIDLGGYEIETMNDLSRALRAYNGGETVTITVWRGGREVIMNITLDAKTQG